MKAKKRKEIEKVWMKIQGKMVLEAMKQATAEAKEKKEVALKKWYNKGGINE